MAINLLDPTCFTSSLYITDTVRDVNGAEQTIPPFPTTIVGGVEVPVAAALVINSKSAALSLSGLTTAEIAALPVTTAGMLAYNSTTNSLNVNNGTDWNAVATTGAGGDTYGPGNPIYLYTKAGAPASGLGISPLGFQNGMTLAGVNSYLFTNAFSVGPLPTGQNNIILGSNTGLTLSSGSDNILIGTGSGNAITTTSDNIGIGLNSLGQNGAGGSFGARESIGIGANTLSSLNQNGYAGTVVGYNAFPVAITDGNTGLGWSVGNATTQGQFNTFIGDSAGLKNQEGGANVMLGFHAGDSQIEYNNCVFLGTNTDSTVNPISTAGALGADATVGASNCFNLGGGMKYGINHSTPQWTLDILNLTLNTDVTGIQMAPNTQTPDNVRSSSAGSVVLFVSEDGNLWAANNSSSMAITTFTTP